MAVCFGDLSNLDPGEQYAKPDHEIAAAPIDLSTGIAVGGDHVFGYDRPGGCVLHRFGPPAPGGSLVIAQPHRRLSAAAYSSGQTSGAGLSQ